MKLNCSLCKSPIPVESVNFHLKQVKCPNCEYLFELPERPSRREGRRLPPAKLETLFTQAPEGIVVMKLEAGVVMQYWWSEWQAIFPLIAAIVIEIVAFRMVQAEIASAYRMGNYAEIGSILLFPLIWVGLIMGYFSLAFLINFTRISVNADQLLVRHGPLPWPGHKSFEKGEVSQLYSKETKRVHPKDGDPIIRYGLFGVAGSKHIQLATGMKLPDQSLYIEAVVEKVMGIDDSPVKGEF